MEEDEHAVHQFQVAAGKWLTYTYMYTYVIFS